MIAKIRINLFLVRHKLAVRSTEMQILEPSDPSLGILLKVCATSCRSRRPTVQFLGAQALGFSARVPPF